MGLSSFRRAVRNYAKPFSFQMSQRHHRRLPSCSLSLQTLHTLPLPPVLSSVVGHNPIKALCCLCQEWLFPRGAGVEPSSLVCFGGHSAHSVPVVVPWRGQRGGGWNPTFSPQGLSGVMLPPKQPGCALAVVQPPSCKIRVLGQCGLSPVSQKTNNNTPAAEEDLFLPPA